MTLLVVEDLTITFPVGGRAIEVVRSVSFAVDRGEMVGLVGESGSGKTMSALAVMRLVPPARRHHRRQSPLRWPRPAPGV